MLGELLTDVVRSTEVSHSGWAMRPLRQWAEHVRMSLSAGSHSTTASKSLLVSIRCRHPGETRPSQWPNADRHSISRFRQKSDRSILNKIALDIWSLVQ
jgi:hypothetical protein